MKIILLTITIYEYVVLGASTAKNYSVSRGLEDIIEDKCFENSHSKKAFREMQESIVDYQKCERRILNDEEKLHPVEQHEEFCRYFETSEYYGCMKDLASKAFPCLDKSEFFFPHMILEAYNTSLDTFCGTQGLLKTEYIIKKLEKNKECIQDSLWTIASNGKCIENLTFFENLKQNILDLNQDDYCNDMESFLDCATEAIEEHCDDDFSIIKLHISELFLQVC